MIIECIAGEQLSVENVIESELRGDCLVCTCICKRTIIQIETVIKKSNSSSDGGTQWSYRDSAAR